MIDLSICGGAAEEHFFVVGDYGGITSRDGQVNRADNTGGGKVRKLYPQDAHPQQDVAAQMLAKAATAKPRFILNGGDNFYFGGIDIDCGQPMDGPTVAPGNHSPKGFQKE